MTAAVANLVPSAVEVALTVSVVAVSLAATVKRPLVLMVVPAPPPVTVQVTVFTKLPVPETAALNCRAVPFCTLAEGGLMLMPVMLAGISSYSAVALTSLAGMVNFAVSLVLLVLSVKITFGVIAHSLNRCPVGAGFAVTVTAAPSS